MFEIIVYLQFFAFIISLSMAVYVFVRNPKNGLHQALAISALGVAGWNLSVFLIINEVINVEIGVQSSFAWAPLTGAGFTWFIYQFPKKIRYYKWFSISTLLLGVFLFLLPLHPDFVLDANVPGGYVDVVFHPVLYSVWSVLFLGNFIYTGALLIIRAFRAQGVDRGRLNQLLLGFFFFFIPSLFANLLLPLIFNDFRWNNFGPVFSILLILFLFNAVMRYRLLDIKWVIGKSAVFTLLIGGALWLVFGSIFLLSGIVGGDVALWIAALLIVLFYHPLEFGLKWLIRKAVTHGGYDPQEATEELFEIVRDEGNLNQLLKKLCDRFKKYFIAEKLAIIVFKPGTHQVLDSVLVGSNKKILRLANSLVVLVKKYEGAIIEKNELVWFEEKTKSTTARQSQIKLLNDAGTEAIVPFNINGKTVGLLVFGRRKFDRALRSQDIEFLDLIRSAIAPALENAAKFEEIKNLYMQLSELDKAKSEFIGVVSHRFRTPLSAIRWNLETVIDVYQKRLGKEATESLRDTHDRTLFLIETLDRLFDSLAIESGKLKLKFETGNPKRFLAPIAMEFKNRCKEKNLKCSVKIPDMSIEVDQKRLSSVIKSFLSNAIQYTSEGGKITFEAIDDGNQVHFVIQDNGIGIPKSDLKKIFDKFYRSRNAILTHTDGQGLGLYFSDQVIKIHKGYIDIDSKLDKGTKFSITLPKRSHIKLEKKKKIKSKKKK